MKMSTISKNGCECDRDEVWLVKASGGSFLRRCGSDTLVRGWMVVIIFSRKSEFREGRFRFISVEEQRASSSESNIVVDSAGADLNH